jgi:hypothetical protein
MKLSNILTVYVVLLDAFAIALLLTATCLTHSLVAVGIGTMGLVTLYLVGILKTSEKVIAKMEIYLGKDRQTEREEEHETNKDR